MKLPPKFLIWWRGMSPGALDAQPIHYFGALSPALAACRYPPAACAASRSAPDPSHGVEDDREIGDDINELPLGSLDGRLLIFAQE